MVSFICNACGQSVRKNQVEKHYQTVCRQCNVLSCIDCGKDFHGEEYAAHTSCISEAEKYQGKLFQSKEKANKGEQKQQEWIKQLQEVTGSDSVDPSIRKHLQTLKQYSNIPRKKAKFQNFCKNSVKIYDQTTLDKLWDAFSGGNKASTQNQKSNGEAQVPDQNNKEEVNSESSKEEPNVKETKKTEKKEKKKKKRVEEVVGNKKSKKDKADDNTNEQNGAGKKKKRKRKRDENEQDEPSGKISRIEDNNNMEDEMVEEKDIQGNFNWGRIIKMALKEAPDNELPVKKLRKKVLAEFRSRGDNKPFTDNELRALFEKKLNKNPKIKVKKDIARLCKKS
ncbi:cell growth-regulating nucleolar protein-like [Actinia tenebrosa]|uniref:Cell growth-regulating nucleolar protein-like n=1 Tax=Actinia tenebrosa TaxID=6105 RepID=A0A6P8HTN6_ACTTE|nr:cell growth-regulating nucleolar protein-like [Actinia tenebrosa]